MATRDSVKIAAQNYLNKAAEMIRTRFGDIPRSTRTATWWVSGGRRGDMESQTSEREEIDSLQTSSYFQIHVMREDLAEQRFLEAELVSAGISRQEIWYGWLLPLFHRWLVEGAPHIDSLEMPFLEEFADAAIDGRISISYRASISSLRLDVDPLVLEEGVELRSIDQEELWELGGTPAFVHLTRTEQTPIDSWKMLHIRTVSDREHRGEGISRGYSTQNALLVGMVLLKSEPFTLTTQGVTQNFGMGSGGREFHGNRMPLAIGRPVGSYHLTEGDARRLQEIWPHLTRILGEEGHFLRLSAQRFMDGITRTRLDDALIDFSIGLESLLTADDRLELRYRFSLRGAEILGEQGKDKRHAFKDFRNLYDLRSSIVHGGNVDTRKLREAKSFGETSLRSIWWWYFEKAWNDLTEATAYIDDQILS